MTTSVNNFFSTLLIAGADAREYLQGQLSCDLNKLTPQHSLLGSCNSPQGRVQAVLTLVQRSDGIALLLPTSMREIIHARLRKYILRSKVTLTDASESLPVSSITPEHLGEVGFSALENIGEHQEIDGRSLLRWHDQTSERYLMIGNNSRESSLSMEAWKLADIRAGLPQVYPETHEAFVAQMLNLDALGGISFEKGCYTGQEIIARTHYRGAVKRRMLRFSANTAPPAPSTRLLVGEEHAGDVVMAAATETGCELLAVVSLAQADAPIHLSNQPLQLLPLPYATD